METVGGPLYSNLVTVWHDRRAQKTPVQLLRALAGIARVQFSHCLDISDRSTVLVVSPSAPGRRAGGRPVWLGDVPDDTLDGLVAWIRAGGPAGRRHLPLLTTSSSPQRAAKTSPRGISADTRDGSGRRPAG